MSTLASLLSKLGMGVALGLQFDPLTALFGALAAAVLVGYPKAPAWRRPAAAAALGVAWLVGDGVRVGRSLLPALPAAWPDRLSIALWMLTSAAVGYLIPAAAGIMVGRRVMRGTGWLSAGAVALSVAGALSVLAPMLADRVSQVVGTL